MSETYTVASQPVEARRYDNKHGGKLVVWRFGLEGVKSQAPDGLFELHKKDSSDPPSVGDRLEVKRTQKGDYQGEGFTRLFLEYTQDGQSGGPSGSDGRFDRRPEHPRNEARMIHTSALSATPAYIEQMLTLQIEPQPKTPDEYWALVGRIATKLTRSYERAMEPADVQQPLPPQQPQADVDGLERKPQADDSVPF